MRKIVAHQPTPIEAYDKDDAEHVAWYYEPLKAKKPVWIDPYINKNLNDIKMISYVIPLFDENKTAVGIIGMDIAMSRITAMVDEIKLYDTGYAFLCDSKGDMVYHNRYPNGMTLEEIKKNSLFTFIDDNYSGEQAGDVINIRNSEGEKRKLCANFLSNGMAVVISVADKEIGRKRISVMQTGRICRCCCAYSYLFTYLQVYEHYSKADKASYRSFQKDCGRRP